MHIVVFWLASFLRHPFSLLYLWSIFNLITFLNVCSCSSDLIVSGSPYCEVDLPCVYLSYSEMLHIFYKSFTHWLYNKWMLYYSLDVNIIMIPNQSSTNNIHLFCKENPDLYLSILMFLRFPPMASYQDLS